MRKRFPPRSARRRRTPTWLRPSRSSPNGYDEQVLERVAALSTGQKQLVGVARALARERPFLVLDEAISSVDSETEADIQATLARLVAGRTSIVIAHRLSTIRQADRIVVLHKGRATDIGAHKELLAKGCLYAQLHQLQTLIESESLG